jgi:hypothetical protein
MCGERGANLLRGIRPFHAGIKAFGILTEHDDIHERFFESAVWPFADEVQRIAREGDAGADTGVEIEPLPHRDDGAEIGVALPTKGRI